MQNPSGARRGDGAALVSAGATERGGFNLQPMSAAQLDAAAAQARPAPTHNSSRAIT